MSMDTIQSENTLIWKAVHSFSKGYFSPIKPLVLFFSLRHNKVYVLSSSFEKAWTYNHVIPLLVVWLFYLF